MNRNDDLLNQALKTEQAGCRKDDTQCCGKCEKSMSREKFEYEAGKELSLPKNIIELARKGDGYDHAFDSMNIMQPLNGWWHWWKAGAASMQEERDQLANELAAVESIHNDAVFITDEHYDQCPAEVQKIIGKLAVMLLPATDRFIAELRAQGVDLVIEYHKSRSEALRDVDRDGSFRHASAMCDAIDVAAQLRNEVNV